MPQEITDDDFAYAQDDPITVKLPNKQYNIRNVFMTPNLLAMGHNTGVQLISYPQFKPVGEIEFGAPVTRIVRIPDTNLIALSNTLETKTFKMGSMGDTLKIYDFETKQKVWEKPEDLPIHGDQFTFINADVLVSFSNGRYAEFYNWKTGVRVRIDRIDNLLLHPIPPTSIILVRDKRDTVVERFDFDGKEAKLAWSICLEKGYVSSSIASNSVLVRYEMVKSDTKRWDPSLLSEISFDGVTLRTIELGKDVPVFYPITYICQNYIGFFEKGPMSVQVLDLERKQVVSTVDTFPKNLSMINQFIVHPTGNVLLLVLDDLKMLQVYRLREDE